MSSETSTFNALAMKEHLVLTLVYWMWTIKFV
jgi:hypothetical protein